MKRLLLILLCISPLMALGQTPGNPTQVNNTNYYSFQNYMGAVQGFMLPQRDTNWTPSAPALVYRPADSSLYYWKWNKWQKVGGTISSNDTSFSLYLLKTDFIDSLNNNRQTITRRNDSLFLTFGGSVSMVPDSTVFPTWYAINDSGYIKKETDPVFTSSPAYTITTLNINNWQTAYNSASTNGDTLILTSITGGVNKIPLLVSQDTTKFRGTGQGYGTIKTGNAKVYGDTLAYSVDTTIVSYPTSVHDSVMSFGNSHNVTVNGSSTIAVTGALQAISNNPSFSLSANNTQPLWNAVQLQGLPILNTAPSAGQVLFFNGTSWTPYSLNPGSGTVTSVGLNAGYGTTISSNTTNPITSSGTFTTSVDTNKIANLRYTDSALAAKKNMSDSTLITGYSTLGGLNDSLNKINGINGWLYNPATKTGQVDSTKYSTVRATHDSIVANIPNLSIYTKYTDTSSMLTPYTKKGELFINVKDYGAKGDSTTDDTHAIQNAFNAVPSDGAIVFFPAGKYIISSPIYVNSSCTVLGTGGFNTYGDITRPFTHLLYANSQIIDNSDSTAFIVNVDKTQWKDIGIANSNVSNFGIGIKFNNGYGVVMNGINVMGFDTCIYMMNGNHYVLTNSQIYYWKNYGFVHSDNNNTDEGSVKFSNDEFYSGTVLSTAYLKIMSGGGITITNCEFEIGSYAAIPPYGILVDSGFRSSIIELSNSYIEGFTKSAFAYIGGQQGSLSGVSINGNFFNSATSNNDTKIIDYENNSVTFTNNGSVNIVGNVMNQNYSSGQYLKYVYLKKLINATITSNIFQSNNTFYQDSVITIINTPNTLILQDSISAKSLTLNGTIADSFYKAPTSDTVAAGFDQNGNMVTFPKATGSTIPTLQQVTAAGNSTTNGLVINPVGGNGGISIGNYMPVGFSNSSGYSFFGYNFTLSSSNVAHQQIPAQNSSALGLSSNGNAILFVAPPGKADAVWPSFFTQYPLATQSWTQSQNYLKPADLHDSLAANALDVLFPLALDTINKTLYADTTEKDSSLVNYRQMKQYVSTNAPVGTGTVTSVGMTVPTGLTISGSPITTTGTLALGLQSGYSIPTTANQTIWTNKVNISDTANMLNSYAFKSSLGQYKLNSDSTSLTGYVSHNALNDTLAGKIIMNTPTDSMNFSGSNLGNSDLVQSNGIRTFDLHNGALQILDSTINLSNPIARFSNNSSYLSITNRQSTVQSMVSLSDTLSPEVTLMTNPSTTSASSGFSILTVDSSGMSYQGSTSPNSLFKVNYNGNVNVTGVLVATGALLGASASITNNVAAGGIITAKNLSATGQLSIADTVVTSSFTISSTHSLYICNSSTGITATLSTTDVNWNGSPVVIIKNIGTGTVTLTNTWTSDPTTIAAGASEMLAMVDISGTTYWVKLN